MKAILAGTSVHTFCFRSLFCFLLLSFPGLHTSFLEAATIHVPAGGDLQAAIDSAQPGDTLLLAAGARFEGSFILRYKPGTGTDADWITIRTSAPDSSLPPQGQRIKPSYAPVLPKILSHGFNEPAIQTEPRAHHYKLIGLEIAPRDSMVSVTNLLMLGTVGPEQDTLEEVPHHLVIDRCWIYAHPSQALRRGVALNSAHTEIRDSYIAGFKAEGQDSQAVAGWNGPGPFKILNNYLEGAGENVMFGGGDPSVTNLVPSDIEVYGNHFYKPVSWRTSSNPHWTVKNLFELKNAQRVVIDGNVFENNWEDAQNGHSILFTVRNEEGGAPWSVVRDVRFTNNIVRHVSSGVSVLGTDDLHPSQRTERITIANNVFEDVSWDWGGSGRFMTVVDGVVDLKVDHNTALQADSILVADGGTPNTGFVFTNNITPHNVYGFFGSGVGWGNNALSTYFPAATFRRNVIPGADPNAYPADNAYPASLDDVGFVDRTGGNYRLAPGSPYKGYGTDGKDPGADMDAVAVATACAVSGDCTPPPPTAGHSPYPGPGPAAVPGTIEAENFDLGGNGIAYADGDAGNNGGVYRTAEDVDIAMTADAGGGHAVGWAGTGEWLKYTVNVTAAGTYDISVRVAQEGAGGTFHIEVDGVDVTGPMTVPATGGWDAWTTVTKTGVSLSAGQQVWRLVMDTTGYSNATGNFNWIDVVPASTPYHGTPFALPGIIQAEDYDLGGAGVAYADGDSGNNGGAHRTDDVDVEPISDGGSGYGIGWAGAGEWLKYTVNVAAAGTYDISVRVAQEGPGGTFHIEVDGVDVTGPMTIPQTGGWGTWTTITRTGVSLSAGRQVWRLVMDTNGYSNATGNFNWIAVN